MGERTTRRQKDISRILREKNQRRKGNTVLVRKDKRTSK